MKFFPHTLKKAVAFFKSILEDVVFMDGLKPKVEVKNFTLVGIHVRRGDTVQRGAYQLGYIFPSISFFKHAIQYFVQNETNVHFVVCSDDIQWCERHISKLHPNIHFSKGHSAEEDLAILSMCHHVIMTTGTFGWWAGWLANGKTIYYKHWPAKRSKLFRRVNVSDYYMPDWIPMD